MLKNFVIQQKELKVALDQEMTTKKFLNNYVLEYIPDNLSWYKRDGLMTYIVKFKYDDLKV